LKMMFEYFLALDYSSTHNPFSTQTFKLLAHSPPTACPFPGLIGGSIQPPSSSSVYILPG
jgi:hypothetical protein